MSSVATPQILMFAAMFAIFYFILLRPQQQEKKKLEELQLSVKKGDEIVTAGGIIGDVVFIKSANTDGTASMDDRVTIRSGESKLVVHRLRISRVLSGGATAAPANAKGAASGSST